MNFETETEIEIPFYDVDSAGIVWHGNYIKYFEVARCALLDKLNYNYVDMMESGYFWPVIDIRLRFAKPAKFQQKIIVRASLKEWENRLKISYLVVDAVTGTRLIRGYSVQVAVDIKSGEMLFASPPVLFKKLGLKVS